MKRLFIAAVLCAIPPLVRGAQPIADAASFDLVRRGEPACTIVIAEKPSPAARLAALEIQCHLLQISGAEIPIRSPEAKVEGRRILVGESAATRELGLRGQDFPPQEYLIAFRPNTLILMGRDWEDTEANRKLEGRPMVGESLAALRHRLDYWFSFVNAVAREVRQTHPDKYIATLAYWAYALPPTFPVEPNVSVAPCLHTCYYPVHPEMKENDLRFYRDWQGKTQAPMFLWVYYHHPMEPALIDRWKCFPHVMVHQNAEAMRLFLRDGVRGIFECGEQDQLEQYVMAKIWDDPQVNVDDLIAEFFELYFGPAGEPMKQFYLRLEAIACDPANYPPPYHRRDGIDWKKAAWERLGTADRMRELEQLMDEAARQAATPHEQQLVALWRQAFWDWMQQGHQGSL